MRKVSFFRLYRTQLLAYSLVVIAGWLAACSKVTDMVVELIHHPQAPPTPSAPR
ncbi:hypothetical protein [Chitinophaga sp.]|uniref:hypothetical protein n=1 Tax=Chitinophaga sp. TaxID=1869181 RepID=UPI002F951222